MYAAINGHLDPVDVEDLGRYETELYQFLESRHAAVLTSIATKKTLDDEVKGLLNAALKEFGQTFVGAQAKAAVA